MKFLRRPWTLQYSSSLYANRCWRTAWSNLLPGKGNALALLGNSISVAKPEARHESREFLLRCAATWERVFVVPGPGELAGGATGFWSLSDDLHDLAQEVEETSGGGPVEVLEQNEVTIPYHDIVILGVGGWGPGEEKHLKGAAASIRFAEGTHASAELATWCAEDMAFLSARVKWHWQNSPHTRVIVLTHSLSKGRLLQPGLPASVYERMAQEIVPAEMSAAILKRPNVYAWLSGALGSCVSGMHGDTFISSNAFYLTENTKETNPNYMIDRHITVGPPERWSGVLASSGRGPAPAVALA